MTVQPIHCIAVAIFNDLGYILNFKDKFSKLHILIQGPLRDAWGWVGGGGVHGGNRAPLEMHGGRGWVKLTSCPGGVFPPPEAGTAALFHSQLSSPAPGAPFHIHTHNS